MRDPAPSLRGHVLHYCGFVEETTEYTVRQELPWAGVVLVVGLGPPYRIEYPRDPARSVSCASFVAGMHDEHVLVGAPGSQRCLQIDFTPLGAYTILGLPLAELTNRSVELEQVLPGGDLLAEQLDAAASWDARFDLLDVAFAARLERGPEPGAAVVEAWRRLEATGGRAQVGALARELGWSRKHLTARFREQIGLTPKATARVLRFSNAMALLMEDGGAGLAEIAFRCGYYDQAHLNRDFRQFADATPLELLRRRLSGVPFVQDAASSAA